MILHAYFQCEIDQKATKTNLKSQFVRLFFSVPTGIEPAIDINYSVVNNIIRTFAHNRSVTAVFEKSDSHKQPDKQKLC